MFGAFKAETCVASCDDICLAREVDPRHEWLAEDLAAEILAYFRK